MELTEEQFQILKAMCASNVYFIVVPDILETDTDQIKVNHAAHVKMLSTFVTLGFAENITDKFLDTIKEVQEEQRKAIEAGEADATMMRGFSAYCLTEAAISMFSAPEGMIN
jgi:hypothetical protein